MRYVAIMKVSDYLMMERGADYERVIKQNLKAKVADQISEILERGYHTVKYTYTVKPRFDFLGYTEYGLVADITPVEQRNIVMPVLEPVSKVLPGHTECCQWCGTVLSLDKRGACDTCGGWIKGG